jgi:hypothetical protein
MDKSLMAFIILVLVLIADVVLMVAGTISADVGMPILTGAGLGAVGVLMPSPG